VLIGICTQMSNDTKQQHLSSGRNGAAFLSFELLSNLLNFQTYYQPVPPKGKIWVENDKSIFRERKQQRRQQQQQQQQNGFSSPNSCIVSTHCRFPLLQS
jgi:hypothetical protein